MQRVGAHHWDVVTWLVGMHGFRSVLDAQGQVPFLGEADVCRGGHAMAYPILERVLGVLRYIPSVMSGKELLLVHPSPGVPRRWSDKGAIGRKSCTSILAFFAVRHALLDARTAAHMQKMAGLHW